MNLSERAVIVKEVPQKCDKGDGSKFVQDLAHDIAQVVRPAVVLDCSRTCRIDWQVLHLFLCSLEEAMKRNGDLRLAGLHQDAWQVLESAGAARLFRNFATTAEAVDSYRRQILDRSVFAAESETDEPTANEA